MTIIKSFISRKSLMILILSFLMAGTSFAEPTSWKGIFKKKKKEQADSLSKEADKKSSYKELITEDAITDEGVITIHKVKKNYYFELPTTLLNRDFLVVNKVSKVPALLNETGVNKGMEFRNMVVNFELDKENERIYLREYKPNVEVSEQDAISQSVADNFISSVSEYFKFESYNEDSSAVLFKVNKLYDGSSKAILNYFGIVGLGSSPKKDHSRILKMKSFEKNLVVKSELGTKIPGMEKNSALSVEVTSNLVLLDEKPMPARFADSRVGIFTVNRTYFSDAQHKLESRKLITRWRLEPKDEDIAKYMRGELVEPKKPIVYYIDPSTPEQWKPYIKLGIEDWQAAFERAGFKNAIIAKYVSEEDKDFDADDIRYSVVTYAASSKVNAMGPSVMDPRSGEILEADIIWWHNVMTALHRWVRIQTGTVDPNARENKFSDEMMGEAIRFVSSHEVGHTFGLMHNMGASYAYSIDSLRSPSFTDKSGTATSIMDYARFNYVAQPGDGVKKLTPKIGEYDKFAIEFAYRYTGKENPREDNKIMMNFLNDHNKPVYFYGAQQDPRTAVDPRSQSEDIGNNSVEASTFGVKNLKRIVPQIKNWAVEDKKNYTEASKLLFDVMEQWQLYSYHVLVNVGGVYITPTVAGDGHKSFEYVPYNKQKQAVNYLISNVFTCPKWLFEGDMYQYFLPGRMAPDGLHEYVPMQMYKGYQSFILWDLLRNERLERMLQYEKLTKAKAYTAHQLMKDLNNHIFRPTQKNRTLSIYERMNQKNFVDALIVSSDRSAASKEKKKRLQESNELMNFHKHHVCSHCAHHEDKNFESVDRNIKYLGIARTSEVISLKRGELIRIKNLLKSRLNTKDEQTRFHYQDLLLRIDDALGF